MRAKFIELSLLCAILIFAVIIRITLINRPFHRDPEGCGSFYGLLARNYWRYDPRPTLGVPVMSMGIVEKPTLYPNHPPLVPLLIAGVFGVAGYTEYSNDFPPDWLVRLPTVPFTLGCVTMLWWMLRRRASPRAGLLAAAIFASMPMTLVYGGLVDVIGSQLDFFILLTIAAYLRFYQQPAGANFGLVCAAFVPAALTDWPAFFVLPVLCGHFALTRPMRQWIWIGAISVFGIVCFILLYMQVVAAGGEWTWMVRLVQKRAFSSVTDAKVTFSIADWLGGAVLGHAVNRHTWPVMILAVGWVVWAASRWRKPVPGASVAGILLGWAFLHILIGRQGVLVHDWWWWPLTPGVAVAAGLMIDSLFRFIDRRADAELFTASLVGLLAIFAGWTTWAAFSELDSPARIAQNEWNYSIVEIGKIIRDSAPPNSVVLLAESDQTLSLWYYADRPLRYQIWDLPTLNRRLEDGSSDLCFNLTEQHFGRGAILVLPKAYLGNLASLTEELKSRYPSRDAGKFLVFDLSTSR